MDHLDRNISPGSNVIPFRRTGLVPPTAFPSLAPQKKTEFCGPISGPMWQVVKSLQSKYPDTFDYEVYDRLYTRFEKNLPANGGVVFKTTLRLVNSHTSCNQCHYAFEIDTYGRGCIHDCVYCYAKDILTHRGSWNRPIPVPVDISKIRKTFATVFESDKASKWRPILEKRVPLRLGAMSDCFMTMDKTYKVTHELLKILSYYNYPYIVFTRGDIIADDLYLKVLRKDLASIQMSISGDNDHLNRLIEPGAPSAKRRFKALKKLNEAGFWTTVRVNPLFPTYPDGYFSNPKEMETWAGRRNLVPKFDLLDISNLGSMISALKEAKVPSVLAGFVRLSPFAISRLSEATKTDFSAFFHPSVRIGKKDRHFSDGEIAFYYKKLQSELHKNGVRFNTCYIGNGEKDFYQYQTLWDNKKDCCDMRGNVPGATTTSQSIDWKTRFQHARFKCIAEESQKQQEQTKAQFGFLATDDSHLRDINLDV